MLCLAGLFSINRRGESGRFCAFKALHNHQLLWHGSRLSNFAGIISKLVSQELLLTHTLTITCTCCYDEIKGTQDLKIYSHADSQILSQGLLTVLLLPAIVIALGIIAEQLVTGD